MVNAIFDWPSWAASRALMGRLRSDARQPGGAAPAALFAHIAVDMALAAICLFGLAIAMANLAHLFEGGKLWVRNLGLAGQDAFGAAGFPMTVMLVSTLLPTALHLFFAVFALAVLRPPLRARVAFWLQEDQEGAETGTQMIVALYLTACAGFAMLVLWAAGRIVLKGLDALSGPAGFWALIFETADRFVFVPPLF